MVFSSSLFLFIFLPIVLLGYYFSNDKAKNIWLLLSSIIFYSWGEPKYVIIMLFSIVINYILGIMISRYEHIVIRKSLLFLAVIFDIGILIAFKYTNFIVNNLNSVFKTNIMIKDIALPIGISFFTFQILSYIIDVYRENVKAQKNILKLGLYISFFPQLIAGPIVRYIDIEEQLDKREITLSQTYAGVKRFMLGFTKKVLIADTVAQAADLAYGLQNISGVLAWIGGVAYMLQIYYDFSGYSDMAIGMGKMFGFDFMENFNYPYISKSIKEFWRRWHISLSIWFRDYVYIPLGGSRCSKFETNRNLLIVFALTGIWHGASWNFVFWGLYYGIFLLLERTLLGNILKKIPVAFQHLYTLIIVYVGWIFFRADSITSAFHYIKGLFLFNEASWNLARQYFNLELIFFMIVGILFAAPIFSRIEKKCNKAVLDSMIIIMFIISILWLVGRGFSPFLYFRF